MNAIRLIAELKSQNVEIRLEDGKVKCRAPKGVLSGALLENLRAQKSEILAFMQSRNNPCPYRLLLLITDYQTPYEKQVNDWLIARNELKGQGIELSAGQGAVNMRASQEISKLTYRLLSHHRNAMYYCAIKRKAEQFIKAYQWGHEELSAYLPHYFGQESSKIISDILERIRL